MRALVAGILALLTACGSVPRAEATRATCGLDEPVWRATETTSPVSPYVYDEACARALGDDLGVRWMDFPTATLPGSAQGASIEQVLAGAWLLLGSDLGSVETFLGDDAIPASFGAELRVLADERGHAPDADASLLVYDYVADRVRITVADHPAETASFVAWDGSLHVPDAASFRTFVWVKTLVHEAGHAAGRPHVDCATGEVVPQGDDADWDGAAGMEAYLLATLLQRAPESPAPDLAFELDSTLGHLCDGAVVPESVAERAPESGEGG